MTNTYPNPWDFSNNDKALTSPNNNYKLVYYDLNEIAMGAPIGGKCLLEIANKKKVLINNWCGGPAVWETDGQLIAIPIWQRKSWKGTVQQIGIVNTEKMELKIFSKVFRVLDLRSFNKTTISGYDSPIHNQSIVDFNIEQEKIETIIQLT